jgi:ERCC4-type nuclease
LLKTFGSIERIAKASVNDLKPVVGATTAREIFRHFKKQRKIAGQGKSSG